MSFLKAISFIIDTGEYMSSKRKRNAKKLPDDFVSIDCIESLDLLDDLVTDDGKYNFLNSIKINLVLFYFLISEKLLSIFFKCSIIIF